MSTEANTSGTTPETPTAPATTPDPFAGSPAPDWVRGTELEKVHNDTDPKIREQSQTQEHQGQESTIPPTQEQKNTAPVTPSQLDLQKFADSIVDGIKRGTASTPAGQPQQAQLSQEEINRQLAVVTMSADDYEGLFGVKPSEAQVAKLNHFAQSVVKQAVTMAYYTQQSALNTLQSSLNPYINVIRAQEATNQRNLFFKEHPELEGYDPIVESEFQVVKASGQTFSSVEEARKFVADKALTRLKSIGITPTIKTGGQPSGSPTTKPPARQMATTSTGGRSGASGDNAKTPDTVKAVWG